MKKKKRIKYISNIKIDLRQLKTEETIKDLPKYTLFK
jgi:hypothetical protein